MFHRCPDTLASECVIVISTRSVAILFTPYYLLIVSLSSSSSSASSSSSHSFHPLVLAVERIQASKYLLREMTNEKQRAVSVCVCVCIASLENECSF